MEFKAYQTLIQSIELGKVLPEAIYLHKRIIYKLPNELQLLIPRIQKAIKLAEADWQIIKFYRRDFKLTFLTYPTFDAEPYPALHKSYTVDLSKLSVRSADYSESENPPILHRRECFVGREDPKYQEYSKFTAEGEAIGLYENTRIIGFRESWLRLISRKGYELSNEGHLKKRSLVTLERAAEQAEDIQRHRTALSRDKLSLPLFLLSKRGYLDGRYSVLDYGCGRGDDLRELEAHGISCMGWDPVFQPDTDLELCDIVNLGYVINVIEDIDERRETLRRAYSFCKKILVVSAMLGNEAILSQFKPYKDGVITSRNTFQKYYFQQELQHFIEETLDVDVIALNRGMFLVFKDEAEEQRFQLERYQKRNQWHQITSRPPKEISSKQSKSLLEKQGVLLNDFWQTTLDLGRIPTNDEFEQSEQIRHLLGSHNKAFKFCSKHFDKEMFDSSQSKRRDDLLVYFALSFFSKRSAFQRMPDSLQRDIKTHFGKYSSAREEGKLLLESVANPTLIYKACLKANDRLPASVLNGQHDLVFLKEYLNDCPPEIRVYVGCAMQLYGDLDSVSLIKIHIASGKVSLMVYDDWEKPVPKLTERIKIKLRDQDIDFFDYVPPFEPQPLENKLDYLPQ